MIVSYHIALPPSRFQLVDFGLAHLECGRHKMTPKEQTNSTTGTPSTQSRSTNLKSGKQRTLTPRPLSNGLIAPHAYQGEVKLQVAKHAVSGIGVRTRGSSMGVVSTRQNGHQTQTEMMIVMGKERGNGLFPKEALWLCPVRHKVTEVCDFCMSR